MIETTVPDKTTGDFFTEQMWDTYIKDNLNNLGSLETALPASPRNGQVIHVAHAYPTGSMMQLRYNDNGGAPGTYPWEFVGGAALEHFVAAGESTASGVNVDLATNGPTVTIPFDGEYLIRCGMGAGNNTANAYATSGVCKNGVEFGLFFHQSATANQVSYVTWRYPGVLTCAAGDVVKMRYRFGAGGTASFDDRWIEVKPVRVGL